MPNIPNTPPHGDAYEYAQLNVLANTNAINRQNNESVMAQEVQEAVTATLEKLKKAYPNSQYQSIADVIRYLKKRKKTLVEQPENLALVQKSVLTPEIVAELISFLNTNQSTLNTIPLCLTAAVDESDDAKPDDGSSIQDRIDNFFLCIHQRKGTCQPGTLGIEGLQGRHPLVPYLLDEAAVSQIIVKFYNDAMREHLNTKGSLQEQLQTIKHWFVKIDATESIFSTGSDEFSIILNKVCEKFIKKGYTLSLLRKKTKEPGQHPLTPYIEDNLLGTPPFLAEFSDMVFLLETNNNAEGIWEAEDTTATLQQHFQKIRLCHKPILLAKLKALLPLPQAYLALITDEDYSSWIDKGRERGIKWLKADTNNALTFSSFDFLLTEIINHIKDKLNNTKKENIENAILNLQPRNFNLMLRITKNAIQSYKENSDFAKSASLLSVIRDNKKAAYLLLRCYDQWNHEDKSEEIEKFIALFILRNNIDIESCYDIKSKIKKGNYTTLKTVLHGYRSQQQKEDFIQRNKFFIYTLGIGVAIAAFVPAIALFSMGSPLWLFTLLILTPGIIALGISISTISSASTVSLIQVLYDQYQLRQQKLALGKDLGFSPFPNHQATQSNIFSPLRDFFSSSKNMFTAYQNQEQLFDDIIIPFNGFYHLWLGLFSIGAAIRQMIDPVSQGDVKALSDSCKQGGLNLVYSLATMARGLLEITSLLFTYFIKIPFRQINNGLWSAARSWMARRFTQQTSKKLTHQANIGLKKLASTQPSEKSPLLPNSEAATSSSDEAFNTVAKLHRKFNTFNSGEPTLPSPTPQEEQKAWATFECSFFTSQQLDNPQSAEQQAHEEAARNYLTLFTAHKI